MVEVRVETARSFAVKATMGLAPIEPLTKTRKECAPPKKMATAGLVPVEP